ncbi:MAG: hypothetical protein GF353_29070 [Candidatus Lokiarchaeota archaeon]|nr:hypothetical protein [Candidatus Lokiarchaeota archaeon]
MFGLLYDGLLIYYTLTNPANIGHLTSPVDVEYKDLFSLLLLIIILIVCITCLLFAKESFKSQQKESKLRGKFIALEFVSWTIGAIADSAFTLNFIKLPIIRILLITSSIEFYMGIVMPEKIKNLLISENH